MWRGVGRWGVVDVAAWGCGWCFDSRSRSHSFSETERFAVPSHSGAPLAAVGFPNWIRHVCRRGHVERFRSVFDQSFPAEDRMRQVPSLSSGAILASISGGRTRTTANQKVPNHPHPTGKDDTQLPRASPGDHSRSSTAAPQRLRAYSAVAAVTQRSRRHQASLLQTPPVPNLPGGDNLQQGRQAVDVRHDPYPPLPPCVLSDSHELAQELETSRYR